MDRKAAKKRERVEESKAAEGEIAADRKLTHDDVKEGMLCEARSTVTSKHWYKMKVMKIVGGTGEKKYLLKYAEDSGNDYFNTISNMKTCTEDGRGRRNKTSKTNTNTLG